MGCPTQESGARWFLVFFLSFCHVFPLHWVSQNSVFYEAGSHLLPNVCHTQILKTPVSKLLRLRSGRNFPPGVVISVGWICSCCSRKFLSIGCFYIRISFTFHVFRSPHGVPTPTGLLFCSGLFCALPEPWVKILFFLVSFIVELLICV